LAYDKEAYKIEAEARRQDLTEKLKAGMMELYDSDKYREYLQAMSHFHKYSRRNIMLIKTQMPHATRVASKLLWEKEFNRHPRKGTKALYIYAPTGSKKPVSMEFGVIDPETKATKLDENGNVITEVLTSQASGPGFRLVPVFDVSQTHGEPLPELVEDLAGQVENYDLLVNALEAVSPLPIEFKPLPPTKDGRCIHGECIEIREDMSEAQTIAVMVHEIAHAKLHDKSAGLETEDEKSKSVKEIEAESIAYVVCQRFGIETGANSFGYLAEWSNHDKDMTQLNASLETIRKEAGTLINDISSRFDAICKERGIDITAEAIVPDQPLTQPPTQPAPENPQEPDFTTETHTENIAGVDFSFHTVINEPTMAVEAPHEPIAATTESEAPEDSAAVETPHASEWKKYVTAVCDDPTDESEPFVVIEFSMNPEFASYEKLSFSDADAKFKDVEARFRVQRAEEGHGGYDKTSGTVFYKDSTDDTVLSAYTFRYDIGDYAEGESGLYNHINSFWDYHQSCIDSGVNHYVTQEEVDGIRKMLGILGEHLANPQHEQPEASAPLDVTSEAMTQPAETVSPTETPINQVPVYKHDAGTARENGEIDAYKQSNRLNTECGQAIDQAISDSNHKLHHYDLKTAAKTVIDQYGPERVAHVLAANIQAADWDGRFSDSTKAWAKGVDIPVDPKVYLKSHPTLLEGFTKRFREAENVKPSVIATLDANAQKSTRQAASKSTPTLDTQTKKPGQEAL